MSDIPQRRGARTARLASLPLGVAGRATVGFGKRMTGKSAAEVTADLQARTAEQLFTVLGELKGGAMKLGQALSVFEAALPEESAAPYREALTKLQEAAPPMPAATVHKVLDEQFGRRWPDRFREFDDVPAAAASIGQVHRAVWGDGREVAVKLQYPGAGPALMADLTQLSRVRLAVQPHLPRPGRQAAAGRDQGAGARGTRLHPRGRRAARLRRGLRRRRGDRRPAGRRERAQGDRQRVDGRHAAVARSSPAGTQEERDLAGSRLALLHYSAPGRAGMLHADPHPGNFRMLPDGRLGVVDFGAVARLPGGYPPAARPADPARRRDDADGVLALMRSLGFVRSGHEGRPARTSSTSSARSSSRCARDTFTFSRRWMRTQAARIADPRREEAKVGRLLNLPPSYLLIHRVTLGSIGVLCQLGATAPYRSIAEKWQPGFAEEG